MEIENTEKLLFESRGGSSKHNNLLRVCCGILMGCGIVLILLGITAPPYVKGKALFFIFGIAVIIAGIVFGQMPKSDCTSEAYLRIFTNHVEGYSANPKERFWLDFKDIYFVKTVEIFANEVLVIESERKTYSIYVDNAAKARALIYTKVKEQEEN